MKNKFSESEKTPRPSGQVRVLLADDHQIVLDGLKSLFEQHADIKIVAEARDGRSAVKNALDLVPDIVLMDINMPELNGIEATHQILAGQPGMRVLILSVHADERFVSRAFEAGAYGYLLKECAVDEVLQAIHSVLAGERYLSPKVRPRVTDGYLHHLLNGETILRRPLSPCEKEIIQLLAEGKNSKEIAARLHVSVKAIEARRRHIMFKIGARSLAELVKYAIREGLTTVEQ